MKCHMISKECRHFSLLKTVSVNFPAEEQRSDKGNLVIFSWETILQQKEDRLAAAAATIKVDRRASLPPYDGNCDTLSDGFHCLPTSPTST